MTPVVKKSIIGTGLSGLVGSRVVELLHDKYDFTDLSLTTGVDITSTDQVIESIERSPAKTILHMAAKTDVDDCEDEKILGEESATWMVNVIGTQNIVEAAKRFGKRIIYISTDFVFDGTKEYYKEEDQPNPVNWYGYTKYEGEVKVVNSGVSFCVVRLAYPYRAYFPQKPDFVRKIMEKAKKGEKIIAPTDHIFTPTFIDDIAFALDVLLDKKLEGTFHLIGSQSLTPYEAANYIVKMFGLKSNIEATVRAAYFKDRAFRPCSLVLKNDKITKLGVKMQRFDEGLTEVKKQLATI